MFDCNLVKCVEGGKHRATNPGSVLAMQSSLDFDISLCLTTGEISQFIIKSLWEPLEQGGTSCKNHIVVKTHLQVLVTFFNRMESQISDTTLAFLELWMSDTHKRRFKDALGGCDSLMIVDFDNFTSRKLIRPLLKSKWVFSAA